MNGSFEDPRFTARNGRQFGPLPKAWSDYKGIYHFGEDIILSYTVGASDVLERLGSETMENQFVFTRTLNIGPSSSILKLRVAPTTSQVKILGSGARLSEENGYVILTVDSSRSTQLKIFIADARISTFDALFKASSGPESLLKYTQGGPAHYPEILTTQIKRGSDDGLFAIDELSPPYENPWNCRMKLSGIDFMSDGNIAAVCTTDGDVFLVTGLTSKGDSLQWKRIGSGLFQPLGLKIRNDKIYVICRDQLVLLHDLNGDDETDYYELTTI